MCDTIRVDVMQGPHQLLGNLSYLRLFQVLIILNNVKQFSLAQFRNNNKLRVGLKRVQQDNNIWMFEFLQYGYLLTHGLDIFLLFALFLYCFYCHKLTCHFLAGFVYFSVGSFADQGDYVVVLSFTL